MHIVDQCWSDNPFDVVIGPFCGADGHISYRRLTFSCGKRGQAFAVRLFDAGFPACRFPHAKVVLIPSVPDQTIHVSGRALPDENVLFAPVNLLLRHGNVLLKSPCRHQLFA